VSALIGCVILILSFPFGLLISRQFYVKKIARGLVARLWFILTAATIEWICGVDVTAIVPSNIERDEGNVVVICNHNCRVDWLFFWCLAARYGKCGQLCIAVKSELKNVPLFGWAIQAFCFLFLSRADREKDIESIYRVLGQFDPIFLLIFPEGTDLSESNVAKAQKYGSTLKPPLIWHHVLIPKMLGVRAAILALKPKVIYDVTISYLNENQKRLDGFDCCTGNLPISVRFHVERIPLSADITSDTFLFKSWLFDRWAKKEKLLSSFSSSSYTCPPSHSRRSLPALQYTLALLFWLFLTWAFFYGLYCRRNLRWALLFVCLLWHVVVTRYFGGLDSVLLRT